MDIICPPHKHLSRQLKKSFRCHEKNLNLFAEILIALIAVRSVNLTKLATQVGKDVKVESSYRRLQRFFSKSHFSPNGIALFITRLFFNDSIKWTLAIDRTNWQYGRVNINILMLSICYKGRAIPVFWMMLNKKGNSNTCERIQLLNRFIRLFGKDRIEALTADREFIGKDFFDYLDQQGIPFVIRIKKSEITTNSRGLEVNIDRLFYHLKPGEETSLAGVRLLWGLPVYLSGKRLSDGEFLIVAANQALPDSLIIYARRWEIETLFECLKTRGFNFEEAHLTDHDKIDRMMSVLAIAYCWSYKTGVWRCEQGDGISKKNTAV